MFRYILKMKRLFFICITLLTLWSCSLDDNSIDFEFIPIEDVVIPESFTLGEVYQIDVTYYRPTTCHAFHDLYYVAEENQRTVAVINIVYDNSNCQPLNDELIETSFNFNVVYDQTYVFKFWQGMDENGDLLREKGMLGIILEKTTREDAMYGLPIQSSQDLTKAASIPANIDIDNPAGLTQMQFEITGSGDFTKQLQGGRQTFIAPILSIKKEILENLSQNDSSLASMEDLKAFLAPSPFIQSDHPAIKKLISDLVAEKDLPLEKTRKLVAWIQAHIQKRPVISLPDALSTLENRVGDCNEHAVLFAALARAAGIPTKIEAGVVFLRKRFFYHAWNSIYVGRWITVDALFDQIPADVTHIRFAGGMQKDQLDILGLIGNLKIQILNGTTSND